MAPFVPIPNGAQVQIVHQLGTEIVSDRLWFTFDTGSYTLSELQGLSDGVAAWWTSNILPFLSSDLITAAVIADDWSASPAPQQAITVVNVAGGIATESLSANVALVVRFKWPLGFRLQKNKHFVPGVPEAEVTLNTPSPAIQDALFEGYAALIDAARLFTPFFHWRWRVASAWEAGTLRTEQLVEDSQGPTPRATIVLGQRRKRLPQ